MFDSVPDDKQFAFCKACRCPINISYEGRLAIKAHMERLKLKHIKNARLDLATMATPKIASMFTKPKDHSVMNSYVRFF
jgi:hypothetical protein